MKAVSTPPCIVRGRAMTGSCSSSWRSPTCDRTAGGRSCLTAAGGNAAAVAERGTGRFAALQTYERMLPATLSTLRLLGLRAKVRPAAGARRFLLRFKPPGEIQQRRHGELGRRHSGLKLRRGSRVVHAERQERNKDRETQQEQQR